MQDALCIKVNDQLLKGRTTTMNGMDKERLLQQTMETCKQISPRINLSHVCQQLSACQYYDQSIALRLAGRNSTLRVVRSASWSVGMQIGHFALRQSLRRCPRHQHLAERHQRRGQETGQCRR